MGSAAFGGTYAAPIWRQFMSEARAGFCGDFPEPDEPAELSSLSSEQTARSGEVEEAVPELSAPAAPTPDAPPASDESETTSPDAGQVPDAVDVAPGSGGIAN